MSYDNFIILLDLEARERASEKEEKHAKRTLLQEVRPYLLLSGLCQWPI